MLKQEAANQYQTGNALISALFIMTLIATASIMMVSRLSNDIYQTDRFIRSDKFYLASQWVPFWAMQALEAQTPPPHRLPANFQTLYPPLRVEGELYDLQARFNLNNLTDPQAKIGLFRLIERINPSMNKNLIKMICAAATDWISSDPMNDKWSSYYASISPAYQASHQLFQSVSEFRLVAGVDAKLFNQLSPYLAALPESTPINLNTAPAEVLATLTPGLSSTQIEQLIAMRSQQSFQTPQALSDLIKEFRLKPEEVSYVSRYFMSASKVSDAQHQLRLYSVLKRKQNSREQWQVNLIQESLNTPP